MTAVVSSLVRRAFLSRDVLRPARLSRTISGAVVMATLLLSSTTPAEVTPALDNAPSVDNAHSNPYQAIIARNAFRLKEPVPLPEAPPPPPPAPETPKLDVKLAGLAKINGVRYAYLVVPDPGRQGQLEYPTLTDDPSKPGGVRHHSGLEIREIDIKAGSVRLVNGGIETTINLKEHGVKSTPAPAAATPGRPVATAPGARPGVVNPNANAANAAAAANAQPASNQPLIFSRNPNRATGQDNTPAAAGSGTLPVNTFNQGTPDTTGTRLPLRQIRTDSGATPTTPVQAQPTPDIPLETQYEILLRQKQAADAVGIQFPPIPGMPSPTPMPE